MKLLFDQNISFRIVSRVSDIYPESQQVRLLGLENRSDKEIWDYAKKNEFTIVSYDSDFNDLATLYGHPPKIIWLRIGNTSTIALAHYFIQKQDVIRDFISSDTYKDISCIVFE